MSAVIQIENRRTSSSEVLTEREILNRQDFVDNSVHALLENLLGRELDWDIETISQVRDAVENVFESNGLVSAEEFYPAAPQEDEDEETFSQDFNLYQFFRHIIRAVCQHPFQFLAVVLIFIFILYGLPIFAEIFAK